MRNKNDIIEEKIGRVRAAVSLEPHDMVPVVAMADFWPVRHSDKYNMQQAFYSIDVAAECYKKAFAESDQWDAFNPLMQSIGPLLDATGSRRYNVPGRDLSPDAEFQHPDVTLMSAAEYPELIENPARFHAEKIIPRLCARMGAGDPHSRTMAWTKAAIFYGQFMAKASSYASLWRTEYGIPPLFQGQSIYVPADWLADKVRGFHQGLLDIKERPAELAAACEALVPFIESACLSALPAARDYPLVFNPQHVSPFISPKDYQKVYWPTFKKLVEHVTGRGFKIWTFFEDNQEQHLDCLQELPRGKMVAHFESTDLARAKAALGGRTCIAGGMPSILLTRGTPEEVKEHTRSVLKLFEDEPGFIMSCSTVLPSNARPENLHAWLDTTKEYGRMESWSASAAGSKAAGVALPASQRMPAGPGTIIPWEAVRPEFGEIRGDEEILKAGWDDLEKLALNFLYWMLR